MTRKPSRHHAIVIFLKGMLIGLADLIPGISGGTIAFVTGIYAELIDSLQAFNITALQLIIRFQWQAAWKHLNAQFLLPLITGALFSIFSFASLIYPIIQAKPTFLYSFFFGLLIMSLMILILNTKPKTMSYWLSILLGATVTIVMTHMPLLAFNQTIPSTGLLFIGGAIAICAMILPGISGGLILILFGLYEPILKAITLVDFKILSVFSSGCVIGLLAFSHLLKWLLTRFNAITLGCLSGLMLGGMHKVWPFPPEILIKLDHASIAGAIICLLLGLISVPILSWLSHTSLKSLSLSKKTHIS